LIFDNNYDNKIGIFQYYFLKSHSLSSKKCQVYYSYYKISIVP